MVAGPSLTPEQVQELQNARERARGILAAAKVAAFNGWSIAVFAGLTVVFGLGSPVLLALGLAMAVVARNEFRGRALLRAFDPSGPRLLTRNQLGFMGAVTAYCAWCIFRTYRHPDPEWAQLQELMGFEPGYIQDLVVAAYACAILLTVLIVGLNARYYSRRGAMLEAYLHATPEWVVALQRVSSVN